MTQSAIAALATLFLAAAFCAPSPAPSAASSQRAPQNVNVTNLYIDTCAKCHGSAGEGGGAGTKTLLTDEKFEQNLDKPFFDAIKKGVPDMGMEAYGETMSDEVVWSLVVHIRELQAKALRAEHGRSTPNSSGVYHTRLHDFKIERVVESGLKTPWAVDWLPDGTMIVTNRPGKVVLIKKGQAPVEISGLPPVLELGQGGMMDVAVHPKYKQNGWIYLALADPKQGGANAALTKIVRGKLEISKGAAAWVSQEAIFEAEQKFYTGTGIHFGSRVVFDGKGHMFFNVGERGGNMLAQKLDNPFGKIYRLNEDGTVPADNPFLSQADGKPEFVKAIWSLGHRNPQGLVLDLNGQLWDTEHGPRGGDEVNKIDKGANYGWPVVAFSINYNDSPFRVPWPKNGEDFAMPAFRWLPSIGACGLDVYRGKPFGKWSGDLLAGGLSGRNVDRLRMKDGKLVEREEILQGMARVRDVQVGPDGSVYVVFNEPDIVIRLVPAN